MRVRNLFLVVGLLPVLAVPPAEAKPAADQLCRAAIRENLNPQAPKAVLARIRKACVATFAVSGHQQHPERACQRQAGKLPPDERLGFDYVCRTAMLMAYGCGPNQKDC